MNLIEFQKPISKHMKLRRQSSSFLNVVKGESLTILFFSRVTVQVVAHAFLCDMIQISKREINNIKL